MRTIIFSFALICAFAVPVFAHGAVVINEIAWMGTAVSASDEWIELVNTGTDDVSLSGWKIVSDDGAPSISLSGTIPAGGYYLLERTDDQSVPTIPADKIYSGDLGNVGETLRLLDGEGVAVDIVIGGSNWESIGGNNTTKDTPQRQADTTWITGVPTPKALNTATPSEIPSDGTVAGTSTSQTTTLKKKVTTGGYKQVVFAYGGEDVVGIAGASIAFEGRAVTDKNTHIGSADYYWSFGDGSHAKGREVSHAYAEPGTYTTVLRVSGDYQTSKDKISVRILPSDIRLREKNAGERGFIEVYNGSDEELDISEWKLGVLYARGTLRDTTFTIPTDTIIAPQTGIKFSSRITNLIFDDHDTVVLQYPNGARADELSDAISGVDEELSDVADSE